jgi:nitrite reductase/ring-hydroxylating ferredoxin subunit
VEEQRGPWIPALAEADLPAGRAILVSLPAIELFLYRTSETIYALDDRCTHMGGPLHKGAVKGSGSLPTVTCPVHGSIFRLTDGRVVRGPAGTPQPVYEARVNDGMVEVRPAGSPSSSQLE